MDGAWFDRVTRQWAAGSRRQLLFSAAVLPPAITSWSSAAGRKRDRRNDRRKHQSRKAAPTGPERGVHLEACRSTGAACASDTDCCIGICRQEGRCTRKKKKKNGRKKIVLTGACHCVDTCQEGACVPPARPTGLLASALDTERIRLIWNEVTGAEGYRIHNGDFLVATIPANSTNHTVSGLAPGAYRCHHIQAFNVAGDSDWSDYSCISTLHECVPDDAAACAGRQCGNVYNNCETIISCGACGEGFTCERGACLPRCRSRGQSCANGETCCDMETCCNGTCVSACCPRRHKPLDQHCQCVDKGPLALSLDPSTTSVAQGSTIDITVRLDMVLESHLISVIRSILAFDASVLEPVSISTTSATAGWDILAGPLFQPGKAAIDIGCGLYPGNIIYQSTNILRYRFRAIGNRGASTAVSFVDTLVLSLSECDQFAENVMDTVNSAVITVS